MRYITIYEPSIEQLNEQLSRAVRFGWQPSGGRVASYVGERIMYGQLVTRHSTEDHRDVCADCMECPAPNAAEDCGKIAC